MWGGGGVAVRVCVHVYGPVAARQQHVLSSADGMPIGSAILNQ